jgi:hypothetical protein
LIVKTSRQGTGCCVALLLALLAAANGRAQDATVWQKGSGAWNDAARWTAGIPNPLTSADVRGNGQVTVPAGSWVAGDLRIGTHQGDRSRVEVNGGTIILVNNSLVVGEESGGQGEFVLNSGAIQSVMDVFVSGGTASTRKANDATLRIRGGAFLGRNLSVGFGFGSHALVAVEGSEASAIHVLDYFYLQATADPGGRPGLTTLSYAVDEHGVTPITIQSRSDGLRITSDAASQCRLEISLRAVPPREDITLVSSGVPIKGAFNGLPEGSQITASYEGITYRWELTYRGGAGGHDLVLLSRSAWPAGAPVTHTRSIPRPPAPLWQEHPVYPLAIAAGEPAFPGAEGYGAYSRGGTGGRTVYVDNLNDSGPGSLRAVVEAEGPRVAIFRVSGSIALRTPLSIRNPFLTVDAQSAPGEGITLRNHGIFISTHDVTLRYFRIRIGDEGVNQDVRYEAGEGEDAVRFESGAKDCIADHLSLSWTTGKIITLTLTADRITIQWCILSESLNFAGHGYASLAGGKRVTWHHNLLAHNYSRNVRLQGAVDADFRNNVIYDWGDVAGYGEFDRLNYVANFLKPGPSTTTKARFFLIGDRVVMPRSIFLDGNVLEGEPKILEDNWRGMGYFYLDRDSLKTAEPFPAPPVNTEPARAAYELVLQKAGDTLPVRDPVDRRVVREVQDGAGHIIRWVREAGQQ